MNAATPLAAAWRDPRARFLTAAAAVYTLGAAILRALPGFDHPERIAAAVAFDLTVTVTLLAWLLPVRAGRWPKAALVPIFFAGVAVTRALAPPEAAITATALAGLAVGGEALLLVWVALRARRGVAAARGAAGDLMGRVREGVRAAVWHRAVAEALAFEIAVLTYAFGGRRAPHVPDGCQAFGDSQRTPYGPVVGALGLVVLAETVPLHFLVARWSGSAAWVVTALGLYALVYLVADWRAGAERPILLDAEWLVVRTGIRWTVEVPRAAIVAVERRAPVAGEKPLRAARLGAANVWIRLAEPVEAIGVYGRRRRVTTIALGVDQPDRLIAALARPA